MKLTFESKGSFNDSGDEKNISFFLLTGSPESEIPRFVRNYGVGALIADFDPLHIKREWKESVKDAIDIPFYEVDARNIVPCWIASPKQEYGAYTLRPKIRREHYRSSWKIFHGSGKTPFPGREKREKPIGAKPKER